MYYFKVSVCFALVAPFLVGADITNSFNKSAIQSTTFKVHDKTPERHNISIKWNSSGGSEVIQEQFSYFSKNGPEIIQMSDFSSALIPSKNGFVNAVVEAFRGHHNLVLRPDDVWAAIMVQFSFYVNANEKELRKKFVKHEGQKKLVVVIPSSSDFDFFVEEISKQIHENLVDSQVKKWILPSFSTTTKNDIVSIGVVFMATMKNYFTYHGTIICGIPSITLEGTVEDWKDILTRVEKLKEYDLSNWYNMLKPILSQFVAAKEGNVDVEFWKQICNLKKGHPGCGGPIPEYLSGWITVFNVFDSEGRWNGWRNQNDSKWLSMDTKHVTSGVVQVPVKVDDNGYQYNATMVAGHVAVEEARDMYTLKPTLGWAIAKLNETTISKENTILLEELP